MKNSNFSLLGGWISLTVSVLSLVTPPVMAKDGVFRTANVQTFSKSLGVMTVPTCVVVDNARHPGVYIVGMPTADLGRQMKLAPGMVVLTIDGYSISSSKVADDWMSHRGNKTLNFTYAMSQNGKPRILSSAVSFGSENGVVSAAQCAENQRGPGAMAAQGCRPEASAPANPAARCRASTIRPDRSTAHAGPERNPAD